MTTVLAGRRIGARSTPPADTGKVWREKSRALPRAHAQALPDGKMNDESETAIHLLDDWFDPIEVGLRDRVRLPANDDHTGAREIRTRGPPGTLSSASGQATHCLLRGIAAARQPCSSGFVHRGSRFQAARGARHWAGYGLRILGRSESRREYSKMRPRVRPAEPIEELGG